MIATPDLSFLGAFAREGMQMSFVVADMDETLRYWVEELGVGPFVVIEKAADDRLISYRGRQTRVKMSIAFSYVGEVQIEVIAASCPDPTPWTDFLESGRQGLHHVAFWPDDVEAASAEIARRGFREECRIETTEGAVSARYFSGPPHLGMMVELAPNTPARARYFGGIKALTVGWDGSRPVRRYETREQYLASGDCRP